jgi:hypothetical protein
MKLLLYWLLKFYILDIRHMLQEYDQVNPRARHFVIRARASLTFYSRLRRLFAQIAVSKKCRVTNLANYTSARKASMHTSTPAHRYYRPSSCKYQHFCLETQINLQVTKKCQRKFFVLRGSV